MRLPTSLLLASLLAAAGPVAAQGGGPFSVDGRGYRTLEDAMGANMGRDITVTIAPGVYRECAVQTSDRVTYRAAQPGTVVFDGVTCEGKAALVLRGKGSTIDGIVFRNMRVGDGNGSGIRHEIGDLTVTNSMFLDSQEGILGDTREYQPNGRVTIDRSTFSGLGQCDETPDCAHSVYLGASGTITITNSRFERGRGGHYVKVRGPRVVIADNSFDDSQGTRTNYAIDLPEGATGAITGNAFVQGKAKENWGAFIAVAAEAKKYRSGGLRIEGNEARLAPGQSKSPVFVANGSGERLAIGANTLGAGVRPYEDR
jgi:hypothetical protein